MVIWLEYIHQMQSCLKLKDSIQLMAKHKDQLTNYKYRKQRELVFRTKGHDCYICGEWATAIDHVVPRKLGGTNDMDNLEPICKPCNSKKGAKPFFLGATATPPVFSRNLSLVTTSQIYHSPFNPDSSQS